jgi:hypothetical protein
VKGKCVKLSHNKPRCWGQVMIYNTRQLQAMPTHSVTDRTSIWQSRKNTDGYPVWFNNNSRQGSKIITHFFKELPKEVNSWNSWCISSRTFLKSHHTGLNTVFIDYSWPKLRWRPGVLKQWPANVFRVAYLQTIYSNCMSPVQWKVLVLYTNSVFNYVFFGTACCFVQLLSLTKNITLMMDAQETQEQNLALTKAAQAKQWTREPSNDYYCQRNLVTSEPACNTTSS